MASDEVHPKHRQLEEENVTTNGGLLFVSSNLQSQPQVGKEGDQLSFTVDSPDPFDKEMFLQALREFKCLWDTSDSNYKNRSMKMNASNFLSNMFNQEGKCSCIAL